MTRSVFTRLVAMVGAIFWSPLAYGAEAVRMEAPDVKKLVDKGEAILIDVRSKAAWDMGHIEGALLIPLAEIEARLSQLPKDKLIVAYCT
jgi:rhodanese-related sulfurtransferase